MTLKMLRIQEFILKLGGKYYLIWRLGALICLISPPYTYSFVSAQTISQPMHATITQFAHSIVSLRPRPFA